ncbi:nitrogenase molybdenum-iron protein NifN [Desulfuromusa kysingii]|uniref:Nitrogenase iron-molybdenum cofactor biosynthesis protein NifN n=1 Tax=Desulfuromusa kysingii TaxID=37625 RepID=A0A1H4DIS1_9BACT|nr:nitrogenase iron-molybdenum cofactor biosynthesis protein NifN [Desulfuromusa kysingii]SEA72369.1 nitrogenase molybdenum-iron protein NifN [Desulfuromusa kysingii]
MVTLKTAASKPLQVNPLKLSQPMGATLAFLGVDGCMPLMHGGQGCASFTKVYLTRHFSEPIALQTTAVTDVTAILDGGDYSIVESIKNIRKKVLPELIGLYTTGLPETKGDDICGVASQIDCPLVYVNTADYEGGLESGWALTCKALIQQLTAETDQIDDNKVVLLPHVSMQPIEVEKVKDFIAAFGFQVLALPDLATSLDGHLGEKQAALSHGGITVEEIAGLADAGLVISVGHSMQASAEVLQQKNSFIRHLHFPHLSGLVATDSLVEQLLTETRFRHPPAVVERWRKRLQDAMLDSHFSMGQTRFLVVGEPDHLVGLCESLYEAGGRVSVAIATVNSPQLEEIKAEQVLVGDLEDAEQMADQYDLIVGNFHCEALAHRHHKGLVTRGFPNWEQVGNQLKNDLLYEGGAYFLFECANVASAHREQLEAS